MDIDQDVFTHRARPAPKLAETVSEFAHFAAYRNISHLTTKRYVLALADSGISPKLRELAGQNQSNLD